MIHFLNNISPISSCSIYKEDIPSQAYLISMNDILILNQSLSAQVTGMDHSTIYFSLINLDKQYKGVQPVDLNQKVFLHYLMSEIPLITCLGQAGTGKSFLTIFAILESLENKTFERAIISKPLIGVSESRYLGTLPGDLDDKLAPFLSSFYDVAYSLGRIRTFESFLDKGMITFEPIEYMRGRSFEKTIVFLDETQSLTAHELLALGTRIGRDSKLILSGDPRQVDNRFAYSIHDFINNPIYRDSVYSASCTLHKRMRSPITEIFEDILG